MFAYCTRVLLLSEHAAYGRILAARMSRKIPILIEMLREGSLTLTALRLLAAHLTPDNSGEVLAQARFQGKREIEKLVARLFPQPAVPDHIRKLPQRGVESRTAAATPIAPDSNAEGPADLSSRVRSGAQGPAPQPRPAARPAVIVPLAPERFKIQFTASEATHEKLLRAQDLLRHQIPNGDLSAVFDRALTVLVQQLEKEKFASTPHPRASRGHTHGSRDIPAAVRRAVWERDRASCAFVSWNGRRCGERGFLEFHHVEPHADGGEPTERCIELRCRAHNQYEAELYFGRHDEPAVPDPREERAQNGRDGRVESG
jgi:hypothetical protein